MKKTLSTPSGMQDVLPADQKYWRYALKKIEALLEDYSFDRIDTPLLEYNDLYLQAAGSAADLAERESITVRSRAEGELAVRSAIGPALMRAYIQHGMNAQPHPVRLSWVGPVVRQAPTGADGLEQVYQVNVQTIGDTSEAVDAELLFLGGKILQALDCSNYTVHINTVGDPVCRPAYLRALKDFYKTRQKRLCAKCRNNLKANPLRLLECAEPECIEAAKEVPQFVDFLDPECKSHFKHLLEFLDEANIPYLLNPQLVRSQDAWTRTVFEFVLDGGAPEPKSVLGGGRHDRLGELVGGAKIPAAGWSLNLSALVDLLKAKNAAVPEPGIKPKVFLAQLGEAAKRKSLLLFEDIRRSGIEIKYSLSRDSIKSQLRMAARFGVRFALIFGQKEALEQTVILREMETGVQETIPLEKVIDELKKRLKAKP